MLKKLFSHTAIYGLAPQITKVASFLTLPIITRDLTAVDFGVSGVMMAYTAAISVLAALGLRLILVNTFYKSPMQYKWAWRQIYGFLTLWNLVYALILGVLIYWIVPEEALHNRWTIVLLNVGPFVFFGQTATIGATFYQVRQMPMQIATRSILIGLLSIALNLLFISHYKMGYMGWFWTSFITGLVFNISYWYPINIRHRLTPIFNFKWRTIKGYLKTTLPTIPHYYSGYLLNSSDRMVMSQLGIPTDDIGKYSAAYTVGNMFNSLSTASGLAVGPMLTQKFKAGDADGARALVFILQVFFFWATFVSCIWLKEVFGLVIQNDVLSQMYPLGIIIIMAYNYRPMYFGSNAIIMYIEKTAVLWKVSFIAGITNVGLNLLLIPRFGFEAAVYVTFASFMYMGYAGFFFRVFKEVNRAAYYPLVWLAATVVLTALATVIVDMTILYKITASIISTLLFAACVLYLNSTRNHVI